MAKGPGILYKECTAQAILRNQLAKKGNDKIIASFNKKTGSCCLLEQDVKKLFLMNDYGINKTEKYLNQWCDLGMIARIYIDGYKVVVFQDLATVI